MPFIIAPDNPLLLEVELIDVDPVTLLDVPLDPLATVPAFIATGNTSRNVRALDDLLVNAVHITRNKWRIGFPGAKLSRANIVPIFGTDLRYSYTQFIDTFTRANNAELLNGWQMPGDSATGGMRWELIGNRAAPTGNSGDVAVILRRVQTTDVIQRARFSVLGEAGLICRCQLPDPFDQYGITDSYSATVTATWLTLQRFLGIYSYPGTAPNYETARVAFDVATDTLQLSCSGGLIVAQVLGANDVEKARLEMIDMYENLRYGNHGMIANDLTSRFSYYSMDFAPPPTTPYIIIRKPSGAREYVACTYQDAKAAIVRK